MASHGKHNTTSDSSMAMPNYRLHGRVWMSASSSGTDTGQQAAPQRINRSADGMSGVPLSGDHKAGASVNEFLRTSRSSFLGSCWCAAWRVRLRGQSCGRRQGILVLKFAEHPSICKQSEVPLQRCGDTAVCAGRLSAACTCFLSQTFS